MEAETGIDIGMDGIDGYWNRLVKRGGKKNVNPESKGVF